MLRNKVISVSRMMKMFRTLRQENEIVVQLKGLCPDNKIPKGVLSMGKEGLREELDTFTNVKEMDRINEKRPETMPDEKTKQ